MDDVIYTETVNTGHNARYFLNLIPAFRNNPNNFKHQRIDLANGFVEIRHLNGNDTNSSYAVYEDGSVIKRNATTGKKDPDFKGTVDDLKGDDFTFASMLFLFGNRHWRQTVWD